MEGFFGALAVALRRQCCPASRAIRGNGNKTKTYFIYRFSLFLLGTNRQR